MTPEKSDHFDGSDSSIRPAPPASRSRRCRGCCSSRERRGRGTSTSRRAAAGARRRRCRRHVHRSRDVSDSDAGREHPDRSDVLAACRSAELDRAAAGAAAGACRSTTCRRSRRCCSATTTTTTAICDASAARRAVRSARRHAAGERALRAVGRHSACRGARLVAGGEGVAAADHADAGAALLRADAVRSKPGAVGRLHAGDGGHADLLRRRHRLRVASSATSGSGSARSTWRCCRSAPTSRAGSCRPFT